MRWLCRVRATLVASTCAKVEVFNKNPAKGGGVQVCIFKLSSGAYALR